MFIAIGLFDPELLRLIGWYRRIGIVDEQVPKLHLLGATRLILDGEPPAPRGPAAAPAPSASLGGNDPKAMGPRTALGDLRRDI